MKTNINELLKPQYTYTSGKWYKKGRKEVLLSTSDLFDLLRSECDKPEINEIVSSMFKHITNHGLYPIVEYPIVGGNRNQMAHITNARREPIDAPSGNPDRETPLPEADAQVLRERIGEGQFDRVGKIGWVDTKPITITLVFVSIGAKRGKVKLFINVIDGVISLGKIIFMPLRSH